MPAIRPQVQLRDRITAILYIYSRYRRLYVQWEDTNRPHRSSDADLPKLIVHILSVILSLCAERDPEMGRRSRCHEWRENLPSLALFSMNTVILWKIACYSLKNPDIGQFYGENTIRVHEWRDFMEGMADRMGDWRTEWRGWRTGWEEWRTDGPAHRKSAPHRRTQRVLSMVYCVPRA